MRHFKPRSHHSGTVLVVGLLLLLVITIVAVASMANTHMQERMAGNARTQALAFEVASGGVPGSLNSFPGKAAITPCATSSESWDDFVIPDDQVNSPTAIGLHSVRLARQFYCIEHDLNEDGVRAPQYFALNIGDVLSGDGHPVARRAIEVRLTEAPGPGGPDCGALCFPGCADGSVYDFPTSNAFMVDGDGNAAITSACPDDIRQAIRDNRIDNYDGGISGFDDQNPPPWPWDKPSSVNDFRVQILEAMGAGPHLTGGDGSFRLDSTGPAYANSDGGSTVNGYPWEFYDASDTPFTPPQGNTTYGTPDNPQITYIAGNAEMQGTNSGAGILIVEGNLQWAGTPDFSGLILVLGGGFAAGGGGAGGNFAGSLTVVNIWNNYDGYAKPSDGYLMPEDEFGAIDITFTGGGTANYSYDCDSLKLLSTGLGLAPDPDNADSIGWDPQCDATGEGEEAQPFRIVSWRETLGWRGDIPIQADDGQ